MGKKAKLTGGNKIPKNMIIRGFVKAFMGVDLDIEGLKIKDDKVLFEMVKGFIVLKHPYYDYRKVSIVLKRNGNIILIL
ncbi:unnamed protein product [marine sediment metagenome]|uniref:Uncharacterized protein n=1 Tax=marine sediment metagenome TaxID=412755 RepID=X1CLQ0_9ZZZZ